MISKAQIKYVQSLRLAKFRQKYNIFIAEGDKMVKEILHEKSFQIQHLIITNIWASRHEIILTALKDKIIIVTEKEMKKLSNFKTPPGVLILLYKNNNKFDIQMLSNKYSIYLDQLSDPGNMGTIIRIADWFGFKNIIRSSDSVDFYNPKTVQASMGSIARVNLITLDLPTLLDLNKNETNLPSIYLASLDGAEINTITFPEKELILVIGNESKGVSQNWESLSNKKIAISNNYCLGAESLNAAVATGIICSKIRK